MDGDDWTERYGNVTVRLSHIGSRRGRVLPDISPQVWRRAARFVDLFGPERSLQLLDQRAERALLAGRVSSACNWRNLMVAVHAMSEEEREDGERDH